MLKKNKSKVIISSVIILLPVLFGLAVWDRLPGTMATHWGVSGNADRFSGRGFFVFGIPAIFLVLHFIVLLVTALDKKQKEQTPKALGIVFWISPMLSVLMSGIMYCAALGKELDAKVLFPVLLGVPLIFMGNYMPKVKQNSTLGFKVWWTLRNEENWNKTHRLGGKLMVGLGFLMLLSAFLPFKASLIVIACSIVAIAIVPMLYSYLIYRQHQRDGIKYSDASDSKPKKTLGRLSTAILLVVIAGAAILVFTGDIEVKCETESIKINATYWNDAELDYSKLETVEYRKSFDAGERVYGFETARLHMGTFHNEEFGSYTLYSYADAKEFIVLGADGKIFVIGMSDTKETQEIFDILSAKIGK